MTDHCHLFQILIEPLSTVVYINVKKAAKTHLYFSTRSTDNLYNLFIYLLIFKIHMQILSNIIIMSDLVLHLHLKYVFHNNGLISNKTVFPSVLLYAELNESHKCVYYILKSY